MFSIRIGLLAVTGLCLACGGSVDRAPGTRSNNGTSTNNNNSTSSGFPSVAPEHATLCSQACAAPAQGPCTSANVSECTSVCAAQTNGLTEPCAACIVSQSGFAGLECTCYGAGCNLCGFGPGDHACNSALPEDTCAASEEVCHGLEVADLVGGPCEATCLGTPDEHPNLADTIEDRCAVRCAERPSACDDASTDDCMTACRGQATGVDAACAVCRIERSGWSGRACTCLGSGCALCGFGPTPRACAGATPEDTCAAEDETCSGLEIVPLDGDCADYCR